jgi:hypothetical protein
MAEFNLGNAGINRIKPTETDLAGALNNTGLEAVTEGINQASIKGRALNAGKKFLFNRKNIGKTRDGLDLNNSELDDASKNFAGQEETAQNEAIRQSYLGTPVYSSLEFPNGQYTDPNNLTGPAESYDGIAFDTVVMKVTQTRNIVENKINGFKGTVKEFINSGDYLIEANGKIIGTSTAPDTGQAYGSTNFLVGSDGENFPYYEVEKLKIISEVPESVKVTSDFLGVFDIDNVVIKSFDVRQEEGAANYFSFKLIMVSDNVDFILEA